MYIVGQAGLYIYITKGVLSISENEFHGSLLFLFSSTLIILIIGPCSDENLINIDPLQED